MGIWTDPVILMVLGVVAVVLVLALNNGES